MSSSTAGARRRARIHQGAMQRPHREAEPRRHVPERRWRAEQSSRQKERVHHRLIETLAAALGERALQNRSAGIEDEDAPPPSRPPGSACSVARPRAPCPGCLQPAPRRSAGRARLGFELATDLARRRNDSADLQDLVVRSDRRRRFEVDGANSTSAARLGPCTECGGAMVRDERRRTRAAQGRDGAASRPAATAASSRWRLLLTAGLRRRVDVSPSPCRWRAMLNALRAGSCVLSQDGSRRFSGSASNQFQSGP
jgi:hypothetical protein